MASVARAVWIVPTMLVAATLVGCESFGGGPASITRDGSNVRVAVCTDIQVSRITGNADYGSNRVKFLQLDGYAELATGTEFEAGVEAEGLSGTYGPVRPDGLNTITLLFKGPDDSFNSTFHDSQLLVVPDSGWLQTDGTVTDAPCVD